MRKYIVILVMATLIGFIPKKTNAATPCFLFNANSITQFKDSVLFGHDPFIWRQLWPAYVDLVNSALQASPDSITRAKVFTATFNSVKDLLSYSYEYDESLFNGRDYENGYRENNKLYYNPKLGTESKWVVFRFRDVVVMFAKEKCGNPQKPYNPPIPYVPPYVPPTPPKPVDTPKPEKPKLTPQHEPKEKEIAQQPKDNFIPKKEMAYKKPRPERSSTRVDIRFFLTGGQGGGNYYPQQGDNRGYMGGGRGDNRGYMGGGRSAVNNNGRQGGGRGN